MAGIGFCLPWLSLLRRPNNTTKADFFPHHFGEGIVQKRLAENKYAILCDSEK